MALNFKEWLYEIRHPAVINPEVKKWVDSADKLKQTVEKLKAILKDKEHKVKVQPKQQPEKPIKKVEPEKKQQPEKEQEPKKPEKPEKPIKKVEPEKKQPEKVGKIELKNIRKPTKVDRDDKKGLDSNDKQP